MKSRPRPPSGKAAHDALAESMRRLRALAAEWAEGTEGVESSTWEEAHALAGRVIAGWSAVSCAPDAAAASLKLVTTLSWLEDEDQLEAFVTSALGADAYDATSNAAIAAACEHLEAERAGAAVRQIVVRHASRALSAVAALLAQLAAEESAESYRLALAAFVEALPTDVQVREGRPPATPEVLVHLLGALGHLDARALAGRAVSHVLANGDAFGFDAVVIPAVLALDAASADEEPLLGLEPLRRAAVAHLQTRLAAPAGARPDDADHLSRLAADGR